MFRPHHRAIGPRSLVALVAAATLSILGAMPAPAVTGGTPSLLWNGHAFGTFVRVGQNVESGKSANLVIGCITRPGQQFENAVLSVDAQEVLKTGKVVSRVETIRSSDTRTSKTTSSIQNVSLLGGLIQADQIYSVSMTSRTGKEWSFSTEGAKFEHLTIAGQVIDEPAENQVIDLPFGRVVLFQVIQRSTDTVASQLVAMLKVVITETNLLGFAKGTRIVVGYSKSGLSNVVAPLGGKAYGTSLNVGDVLKSGPSFTQYLPCHGTEGKTIANSGTGLSLLDQLGFGTIRNTAKGTVTLTRGDGTTSSAVQNVDLAGAITADEIQAVAFGETDGETKKLSSKGSHFAGLTINGQGGYDDVKPNTKIELPEIGTLTLYEVTRKPNTLIVTMLHLVVGQDNRLNLPAGTDLTVATARIHVG